MAFPDSDLTIVHLDEGTDDPSQARDEIKAAIEKINAIIDATITAATADTAARRDANADLSARRFISNMADGTAPLSIVSTTKVANLNADRVDGYDFNQALLTTSAPIFAGVTAPGITTDGISLRTKIVNIGDWNMDTTEDKPVTHGLTLSKIRSVSAMIRNDAGNFQYDLYQYDHSAGNSFIDGGIISISATAITLRRMTTGFFDNANFNSTSYNRGWVTIVYEA